MRVNALCLSLLLGLTPALATSGSVYKWTDENGVTHFGDREPSGRKAEQVNVKTGSSGLNMGRKSPQEQVSDIEQDQEDGREQANLSAVERAQAKQRQANCETARANLEVIRSHARIRVEDGDEPRYLGPEEVEEQRKRFEEIADENCGPAPASNEK